MDKIFSIIGLILNLAGTMILMLPLFQVKKDLDDDEIIDDYRKNKNGKEKYYYTRRGFIKDKNLGLLGLGLMSCGFIIQLFLIVFCS